MTTTHLVRLPVEAESDKGVAGILAGAQAQQRAVLLGLDQALAALGAGQGAGQPL